MAKRKQPFNIFYVPLLLGGVVFLITACAYGLMVYQTQRLEASQWGGGSGSGAGLIAFMNEYGTGLLLGELAVLAVATIGTIAWDRFWWSGGDGEEEAPAPPRTSAADSPPPPASSHRRS